MLKYYKYQITLTSTHFRNFFPGKEGDLPVGFPERFNSVFSAIVTMETSIMRNNFPKRQSDAPRGDSSELYGDTCGFVSRF